MNFPRVVIAAPKSGSGKTLITISLIQALLQKEIKVSAFKCGPDYIDPMFHKKILGVPSKNLDLFFVNDSKLKNIFCSNNNSDISVIEGVMGLYDGLGGISQEASTYEIAKSLNAPVILVLDCHGMARSIIPELMGFVNYDKEKLIKGVILNNLSAPLFVPIKNEIEKNLGIKVLGYFPHNKNLNIESRHLGLKLPNEINDLKNNINQSALNFCKTVDVAELMSIAKSADEINYNEINESIKKSIAKIAVAKDEAFCFYYQENLDMLKTFGAEIIEFSPLHDDELPEDICGIILGGGYPELYADQLEKNLSMKDSIKKAIKKNIPVLAECGGFMYLHKTLKTSDGTCYKMVGAINGDCFYSEKLVRFGYVKVYEKNNLFLKADNNEIRGHEFHYFDSTANGNDCVAKKALGEKNWECSFVSKNSWMGFAHFYYDSNPEFPKHFVEECIAYKTGVLNEK